MPYVMLPWPAPTVVEDGEDVPIYDEGEATYDLAYRICPERADYILAFGGLRGRIKALLVWKSFPEQTYYRCEDYAGFLCFSDMKDNNDDCYSPDIFVTPDHRGGTAGFLLAQELMRQWQSWPDRMCHMLTFDKTLRDMMVKFFGFQVDEHHYPMEETHWELCGYDANPAKIHLFKPCPSQCSLPLSEKSSAPAAPLLEAKDAEHQVAA